jgi:DNA-binding transcriptional regulator YiaG
MPLTSPQSGVLVTTAIVGLLWQLILYQSTPRMPYLHTGEYSNLEYLSPQGTLPRVKKSIYSTEQTELLKPLREKRKAAGFSQLDLAKQLGRSQSFVSKYESGELRLDLVELRSICQILGTSLSSFVRQFEKRIT